MWLTLGIVVATAAQLFVATFVGGLPQFEGKAFGSRLVLYPVMMLAPALVWAAVARARKNTDPMPWGAFAFIAAPFLVDVTGNTFDLYDTVQWWDDLNHYVNWLLLGLGVGLMLWRTRIAPPWALAVAVTGIGSMLALGWELGEWFTFIRHGKELATAYEDTLGDEALGTLGAATAGIILAVRMARGRRSVPPVSTPGEVSPDPMVVGAGHAEHA